MDFWRSIGGMVEVELTSANLEELLTMLNACAVELYSLHFQDEVTCRFRLRRQSYAKVRKICKTKGAQICLVEKRGSYWQMKQLLCRPVLVVGLTILFGLVLFLPTRVLFFEVTGNETVPANRILEAAQDCGIRFGASRRAVRSEKVKNELIGAVPELQWVGVNTRGCVAVISVRERSLQPEQNSAAPVSSLVADRDGYILSATATRGNLIVQPGQAVQAGQVLISGYSDLGLHIQATCAEGEVYAQTSRQLEVITPAKWLQQRENGACRKKISLILGKNRINLWKDSGISDTTCGRMYEEYYVTLPGGFSLPAAICVETYLLYDTEESAAVQPQTSTELETFARRYLLNRMVAGEIKDVSSQWMFTEELSILTETYTCHEMIGRRRQEQIGEIHE